MNDQMNNPTKPQQEECLEPAETTSSNINLNTFLSDLNDLAVSLERAVVKTAENICGLIVIPVSSEDRYDLDVLIEAGLAKTRSEAVIKVMHDGIRSNEAIYKKVTETRKQIEYLHNQLRSLRTIQS